MEQITKYDMISVAYRSRLLFRTDAEYREALRVSFETVSAKRDNDNDLEIYYNILNRSCELAVGRTLSDVIHDYVTASRLYRELDWGDRTQMASRKKFCRMLFRLYATAGKRLSGEDLYRFRIKDDDTRLLRTFFPEGVEEAPAANICMIILFAFGIIRPYSDISRSRDISDKETLGALVDMSSLIRLLKEDTPRLGSTAKPIAFDEWLGYVERMTSCPADLSDYPPIRLLSSLTDIARACRALVVSGEQRIESEMLQGLYMHGIWVDDADGGDNRFWIFPDNILGAFCYRRQGLAWELIPYDMKIRRADYAESMYSFILLTPQGNLSYTLSSDRVIPPDQLATGLCRPEAYGTTYDIGRLTLREESLPFPGWLDWHAWQMLSPDDPRYGKFHTALTEIYDPRNPLSAIFQNTYSELIDTANNLIGRDQKYLYVYDRPRKRFRIREKDPGVFTYESDVRGSETLLDLDISEQHPLYAIPVEMERRQYGNPELDRLAEILADASNISEIYILHSESASCPRLVFPSYGTAIALRMADLSRVGVLRLTCRPI